MYNKLKIKDDKRIFMNNYKTQFKVMRNLMDDKLVCAAVTSYYEKDAGSYADILYEIYSAGAENNFCGTMQNKVLHDENAFSLACARGAECSEYLKTAYLSDLKLIFRVVEHFYASSDFAYGDSLPVFKSKSDILLLSNLQKFYAKHGCGQFIDNKAFEYANGKLIPLNGVSDITLSQLKNYAAEKTAILNNVSDFICGLPYSHMLLYGDRGTGKSSTVHAVLNEYFEKGLRLIEIGKETLNAIKEIKQRLSALPLKFIIFIDDLSLSEQDEKSSTLKAAVEGSVVGAKNVMVVTTSNRRHVVKESFSDRENSVHPSDNAEELLSLSDRFGLTVMFSSTDKANYLSIVRQLAEDMRLKTPTTVLETLAERWALINGGRSPRKARQFADFAFACEQSGREITF